MSRCPRDGHALTPEAAYGGTAGRCGACGGLWLPYAVVIRSIGRPQLAAGIDNGLRCPQDSASLQSTNHRGVPVEICPRCKGVWLDGGELDAIVERVNASRAADESGTSAEEPPPDAAAADPAWARALEALALLGVGVRLVPLLLHAMVGEPPRELGMGGMVFLLAALFGAGLLAALAGLLLRVVLRDQAGLRAALALLLAALCLLPYATRLRAGTSGAAGPALEQRIADGLDPNLAYSHIEGHLPDESIWSELGHDSARHIITVAERFPDLHMPQDADGRNGVGPLQLYAERDDGAELITYFMRRGFLAREVSCYGETALHRAAQSTARTEHALQVIDLLLGSGADIDARDANLRPPLSWASRGAIVQHLIEHGAQVNLTFADGERRMSVLDYAEARGWSEAAAALRAAGARKAVDLDESSE